MAAGDERARARKPPVGAARDERLMPRSDVAGALARLDLYRLDEDAFNQFRRRQFADYLAAGAEAHALRHFL
eukprot:gene24554-30915_t